MEEFLQNSIDLSEFEDAELEIEEYYEKEDEKARCILARNCSPSHAG